jgi:serine/threonine protein kinase
MRATSASDLFGIFEAVNNTPPGQLPKPVVPGLTDLHVFARGGYATVYRATQGSVGREVAVKVENRTLGSERDQRRFLREARAAGRMSSHPHVVDLFDAGVTEDQHPYLIMELCDGSYAERMRTSPLGAAEARDLGVKIADALAHSHAMGVLHRDVKPANILHSHFNPAVLADFGLAVLAEVRDSSVTLEVLTPAYAPPEMFRHSPPSPAVDVYALCATLYAVMHGKPPRWQADRNPSLITLMELFSEPIPELPGVPSVLIEVLRYGMTNDPEARPSAAHLRDLLAALPLGPSTSGPIAPISGAPISGAPVSGAPVPGAPVSGAPVSGIPVSGSPIPISPVFGMLGFSTSISGAPGSGGYPTPAGPTSPRPPAAGRYDDDHPTVRTNPRRRRRLRWFLGGLGALLVMTGAAASSWYVARTGPVPSPSSSARTTAGTPAAPTTVAGSKLPGGGGALTGCRLAPFPGGGRCTAELECFGPMQFSGTEASAERVPCAGRHSWEAYAVGDLPIEVDAADHMAIWRDHSVQLVCNADTFRLATGLGSGSGWLFELLPPNGSELAAGERTYRCLAGKGNNALTAPTLTR